MPIMIRKIWILSVVLAFQAALPSQVRADDDDTDEDSGQLLNELFQSTVIYPQAKGEIQWTFAPSFAQNPDARGLGLPVSFEYGISDRLQVELAWEEGRAFDRLDRVPDGAEGVFGAGLQYTLMNIGGRDMHAALGGEFEVAVHRDQLILPGEGEDGAGSGDEGESRASFAPYATLAADFKELGGLHLTANGGVELSNAETEPFLNLGMIMPLGGTVMSVEWNWSEEEQFLTPGLTHIFGSGWEIGVGAAIGVQGEADDFRLLMNIIYEY